MALREPSVSFNKHEVYMNRIIVVVGVVLALGTGVTMHAQQVNLGQGDRAVVLTMPLEAKVVRGLPYSAETVTERIQTLPDGNRIAQRMTGRDYRDSEGRTRHEVDRPSGTPVIFITDPLAGSSFRLDPANRTAQQTPTQLSVEITQALAKLQAADAAKRRAAQAAEGSAPDKVKEKGGREPGLVVKLKPAEKLDEQVEETLPDRVIESVLASGVRRTTTIKKGAIGNEQPITIVSEEWTSPDLQILVLTDHRDPRTGRSTYRLLNISRLDPDPALFQVPPDYTVQRVVREPVRGEGAGGRGGRGQD
jgi:hypothetical protein